MADIRLARPGDAVWLEAHDPHIAASVLAHSIEQGWVYMALVDGMRVGWLRYNLFWDNTPFLNLLYVLEEHRAQGVGSALMRRWEADMRALHHPHVLTSTQANECAQHFYRKLGYEDVGGFKMRGEAYELILCKTWE